MIDISINSASVTRAINETMDVDWLYDATEASLAILHDEMARYPAPPANSRYRRTGTLGRTWSSRVSLTSGGVEGELGNNARSPRGRIYGPYVQDHERQARWHVGRWQTDRQVADRNEGRIIGIFERMAEEVLR
jgi:hypothetical protein